MSQEKYTAQDVIKAFEEGFEFGVDRGNLPYKYPPVGIVWLFSEARFMIPLQRSTEQQKAIEGSVLIMCW